MPQARELYFISLFLMPLIPLKEKSNGKRTNIDYINGSFDGEFYCHHNQVLQEKTGRRTQEN